MRRNRRRSLDAWLEPPPGLAAVDFSAPEGAPALFAPESVSWCLMKNPVALFVGGVAAVVLELAEPRVRSGVWEHSSFRHDPFMRIRRTGYAAMTTVYAPAEVARKMIAAVRDVHTRISGTTPNGAPYRADDRELLDWVHATASYGFLAAYHRFVHAMARAARDNYFEEGASAAALYGAYGAPRSEAAWEAHLLAMLPKLERSDIVAEFLRLVEHAPLLPSRTVQGMLVRAAVDIVPAPVRALLCLGPGAGLRWGEATIVSGMGAAADRIVLKGAPPAQACARVGRPAGWLYR